MGTTSEIKHLIRQIANGPGNTDILFEAEVTEVQDTTITVKYQGLLHENVRLSAGFSGNVNTIIAKPKVGSLVLVADISEGKMRDLVVLLQEETDEIVINGGELGGLIKIEELTKRLNAIEKDLNNEKNAFKQWVVAPNDGGAALKAAVATWAGQTITETKQSDIEDEKIRH